MSCNETKKTTSDEKCAVKKDLLSAAYTAMDAVLTSVAGTKAFQKAVHAVSQKAPDAAKAQKLNGVIGAGICTGVLFNGDFIPTLAQALDRMWAKDVPADEEAVVEDAVAEAQVEDVPVMAVAVSDDDDDDDDSFDDDEAPTPRSGSGKKHRRDDDF